MASFILVPIVPTAAMIEAADFVIEHVSLDPCDVWRTMLDAAPDTSSAEPAEILRDVVERQNAASGSDAAVHLLTRLPTVGAAHRNPAFWADLDVRRMVIECHRQMTVEQARDAIRDRLGDKRTPSKSALARAWKRLDRTHAGKAH